MIGHEINRDYFGIQGESKKKVVISGVWCKIVLFLCGTLLYVIFSIFFRFLFFVLQWPKKNQILTEILYIHIFAFLNFWFWKRKKFCGFFLWPLEYKKINTEEFHKKCIILHQTSLITLFWLTLYIYKLIDYNVHIFRLRLIFIFIEEIK